MIVQYFDNATNEVDQSPNNVLSVKGKVWPNQVIGGIFGTICLLLSIFAFIGAQKHGAHVKQILENGDESTEDKVLASLTDARVAAGPTGPPADGPTGPPPAGPTGPPQPAEPPAAETPAVEAAAIAAVEAAPVPVETETPAPSVAPQEATFEPAEGGYFYKKLPDGSYEQTVYVQNSDGTYAPYDA